VGVGGIFTQGLVSDAPDRTPPAWELLGTAGAFFGTKMTSIAFWDHGCDHVLDPRLQIISQRRFRSHFRLPDGDALIPDW
jgi:hypothetical protein